MIQSKWRLRDSNITLLAVRRGLFRSFIVSVSRSLDNSILREYDIRVIVGQTLFAEDFLSIGHAFGNIVSQHFRQAATVVVGYDGRLSSPNLFSALSEGLMLSGVKVINVGLGPSPLSKMGA